MPEVFSNNYTFASTTAIPTAEQFGECLSKVFGVTFELTKHDRGEQGAPRAYASLQSSGMQIWIFWEPDRPEIEVSVGEPMEHMIQLSAAITALGGQPRYVDASWRARRRYRTQAAIGKAIISLIAAALAIATIWSLHWWGLLIVIATIALLSGIYVLMLARAFSKP